MKIIATITLWLFQTVLFGQNYINYFNTCNEGDKLFYNKKFDSALVKYEEAYNNVNYLHINYLIQSSFCASKTRDFQKAKYYSKRALIQGASKAFIYKSEMRKFRKSKEFLSLKDSVDLFMTSWNLNVNQVYKKEIDSLYIVDQIIIRGNPKKAKGFDFDFASFPEFKYDLDSSNFEHLLSLISLYGFPSERLIGQDSYNSAFFILLHNVRLPQNSEHLGLIENALKKGEFLPKDFAWTVDQSLSFQSKPLKFYYAESSTKGLTEKELTHIDSERKKFGVKPLEAFKTTQILNLMIITRPVW